MSQRLFSEVVSDIQSARGVDLGGKNPLLGHPSAVLDDGTKVYDFGVEISEPLLGAVTTLYMHESDSSVEIEQAANSVLLMALPDGSCEVRFDSVDAMQRSSWNNVDVSDKTAHELDSLAKFVDGIAEDNYVGIGERYGSQLHEPAFMSRINDLFDSVNGAANGEDRYGLSDRHVETMGVMSTAVRVTGRRAENMLDRLRQEPRVSGARELLSDFTSGNLGSMSGKMEDFSRPTMDGALARIREALVTGDYEKCQASFGALLEREMQAGDVFVAHHGFNAMSDRMFNMESVSAFMCKSADKQVNTFRIADNLGRENHPYYDRMRADGVFYGELVSSAVRDNGDVTRQSVPTAVDRTVHPGAYKTGHELENVVAGNSLGFAKTPIGGPDSFSWDSDEHDEVSLFM